MSLCTKCEYVNKIKTKNSTFLLCTQHILVSNLVKYPSQPVKYCVEFESMSWATKAISKLKQGESVTIRPRGGSMRGKIKSGQEVTILPIKPNTNLTVGAVVLVSVKGRDYLHLIKQINKDKYLIGNNIGGINGWVKKDQVHGIKI